MIECCFFNKVSDETSQNKEGNMKHLWLNTVLNRPWLILLIGMLLITAATMGGKNLYFRGDYKVFFDDDNPG